jgi:hypothetical protein
MEPPGLDDGLHWKAAGRGRPERHERLGRRRRRARPPVERFDLDPARGRCDDRPAQRRRFHGRRARVGGRQWRGHHPDRRWGGELDRAVGRRADHRSLRGVRGGPELRDRGRGTWEGREVERHQLEHVAHGYGHHRGPSLGRPVRLLTRARGRPCRHLPPVAGRHVDDADVQGTAARVLQRRAGRHDGGSRSATTAWSGERPMEA